MRRDELREACGALGHAVRELRRRPSAVPLPDVQGLAALGTEVDEVLRNAVAAEAALEGAGLKCKGIAGPGVTVSCDIIDSTVHGQATEKLPTDAWPTRIIVFCQK